ncbi:galactose-3-O-sulfotransferase 2-like [Xyrichtys novacula]|uniref:Galactose-3-O-sulfotransferase 2-like n=1 Tax=Xyrichtys novacula TaxID=13765 RepID=A0AAV1FXG0_XYRNO|nr:galactose-3-O-sulfotransferase 2-like [Xyrichtys novacula]
MLSPQRRQTREQPVSSLTSCVGRWLCSRRPSLWVLLIILIICIAIQIFVAHQTGHAKLMGPQHLTANKQQLFPTLQNILESFDPEILRGTQSLETLRKNRTADSYNRRPQDPVLSRQVDKMVPLETEPQSEAGKLSLVGLLLTKLDNKPRLDLSHSLVPQRVGTYLSEDTEQRLSNSPSPSSPLKAGGETACLPKSHIVFLKTHKTASSTILNILYRYGESRNLTFALPVKRQMQLFYPHFFAERFVEGAVGRNVKEFHIMCNHMRFIKSEVAKVMPEETFYFSILRHPVVMMESIYTYYKSIPVFRKSFSMDNFLDNSLRNQVSTVSTNHYAHNVLAFDFGLENNVTADSSDLEERARRAVAAIERDFQLILISEYFDESMILLKHTLCWSLEDVVYFKLNSRSEGSRQPPLPVTAEKIKRWNALDWRIYLHFNATFWHRVESLIGTEQVKREVDALRELQAKLAKTCLKDGGAVHPAKVKDVRMKPYQSGKAVIQGYNLNPLTDIQMRNKCQKLITPELQYTKLLYNKQFPGFHD